MFIWVISVHCVTEKGFKHYHSLLHWFIPPALSDKCTDFINFSAERFRIRTHPYSTFYEGWPAWCGIVTRRNTALLFCEESLVSAGNWSNAHLDDSIHTISMSPNLWNCRVILCLEVCKSKKFSRNIGCHWRHQIPFRDRFTLSVAS